MKNESILTRRGFLKSLGLIIGAVVVAPATLVEAKQYYPDKVLVHFGGERLEFPDFSNDFSRKEITAIIDKQLTGYSATVKDGQVTLTSDAQGDSEYYEVLGNEFQNFRATPQDEISSHWLDRHLREKDNLPG